MCAANRKIIWLDTEYSTNWDSRIMYMYVYKFIQNIRWWQLKWKIVIHVFRWFVIPRIDKGDSWIYTSDGMTFP